MSDLSIQKEISLLLHDSISPCLHFECEAVQSEQLWQLLRHSEAELGAVLRGEGYYENLTLREYLRLFAGISGHRDIDFAIREMALSDLAHSRMRALSAGQKKRAAIARELLKQPLTLFVEEPLQGVEEESARILLHWLEELPRGLRVITASASTKHVFLLPGPSFYFSAEELRPLEPAPSAADAGLSLIHI